MEMLVSRSELFSVFDFVELISIRPTPVADARQRQANAIEILRILTRHPAVAGYLNELLAVRYVFVSPRGEMTC